MRGLLDHGPGATFAAAVLVWVTACSPPDPQAVMVKEIHDTYAATFETAPPTYVVLTYPGAVASLSKEKRVEYYTLLRVLDELRIPHETKPHEAALTTFEGRKRSYLAYDLPTPLAERCRNGTLLFLNLGQAHPVKTTVHPNSREYKVVIKVATDPVRFSPLG